MRFIGIDPGKKGGIAWIDRESLAAINSFALPFSHENLLSLLSDGKDAYCVVEKVASMPQQGVKSMFTFGEGFGYIQGVLEATKTPYELLAPTKWKRFFSLGHDKQDSIKKAQALFPNVSLLPSDRCRVSSDGIAEALLLAFYAMARSGDKAVDKS